MRVIREEGNYRERKEENDAPVYCATVYGTALSGGALDTTL